MKIYPRRLTSILIKETKISRIVVLTGMRQVGKTTLMRQIYDAIKTQNKIFLDMENPLNQKIFEEENFDNIIANLEPLGFSPEQKSFIFLDEIQVMPKVVKAVKYLYDHYNIKFFLTGSSSFYLKNLFPESLAGRKIVYELFPLDFEEFLVFKEKEKKFYKQFSLKAKNKNKVSFQLYSKLLDEHLEFGGFPAVVIEEDRERKKQILKDIFTSYFEKDVRTLADFREMGRLRDLILLLTNRIGSKIEISKIASELAISRETVYTYLNFLEKTYFIFLINSFTRNINGEVRGAKKIYFCDNGLLNYLGKVSAGTVFENFVFHNLRKYGNLNYYQKYKGPEIDFILDKKSAFEVKISAVASDINRLQRIANNLKLRKYYLITKNYSDFSNVILAQDL
jgi:hypothetical protein